MNWRALLQTKDETLSLPWLGGRTLRFGSRGWHLGGVTPREHGWCTFSLNGRNARLVEICQPEPDQLKYRIQGYLVGDLMIPMNVSSLSHEQGLLKQGERLHLIPPELDRFSLVTGGRTAEDQPLVFVQQEYPLGPEPEVQAAYLDNSSLDSIKGVSPSLHVAFKLSVWQRAEAERRRQELEKRLRLEAEARQREARRQELVRNLGDGETRRELAAIDFAAAARAALTVGGAEFLESRPAAARGNEMVVRFRFLNRRFECTCDRRTLQIIDSGICLTAHDDRDGFEEGTRGDTWFTLESLPAVIREADREHRLVVFRHV